jgi:hypothetical protein
MPANLPRSYHKKEAQLRFAQTPEEKISILKEMLAIMPHHKGTDRLRAELNTKISKLKKESLKKPKIHRHDIYTVAKDGIGQVVLMGPPNSGKSTILSKLTNAKPEIAPYPYTTQKPNVGMIEFENVKIQLVDTPPLYEKFHPPWLFAIGRSSDLLIGVIKASNKAYEELERFLLRLEEGNMLLQSRDFYKGEYLMQKYGFIIITRQKESLLISLREKYSEHLDIIGFSVNMDFSFLKKRIYDSLSVIRIYTKPPGKDADFSEPVVLEKGSNVLDAAYVIHKDFAEKMKYTKLWRGDIHSRHVGTEEVLEEGDIVEFHSR